MRAHAANGVGRGEDCLGYLGSAGPVLITLSLSDTRYSTFRLKAGVILLDRFRQKKNRQRSTVGRK